MSWIKENKFLAVLIAVVVIVGGALFYLGSASSSRYSEAKDSFDNSVNEMKSLAGGDLFPSDKNADAKKKAIEGYLGVAGSLQKKVLAYRPGEIASITPAALTDQLKETETKLFERFEASATELPEGFHMGFEKYFGSPAKNEATGKLSYQLKAVEWLLNKVADAKPAKLLNVYRPQLPIETGAAFKMKDKTYQAMPLELCFEAEESKVREFLGELANSKEYFFRVNLSRVSSTNLSAPSREDAEFSSAVGQNEVAGGGTDDFNFDFDEADGAADAEAGERVAVEMPKEVASSPGDKILMQVLGGEKVIIYLSLDLLLFNDATKLPN